MNGKVAERQDAVNIAWTPAGEAFTELIVAVFRLNGLLVAAGDALARPTGQTSARWKVMAAIEDGPAPVAQIARVFGLARQSVQRVADLLVADGLARYEDNPRHRRAKLLTLTPRGRAVVRELQAAQKGWANGLGAGLGGEPLREAAGVLERVIEALETEDPTRRG